MCPYNVAAYNVCRGLWTAEPAQIASAPFFISHEVQGWCGTAKATGNAHCANSGMREGDSLQPWQTLTDTGERPTGTRLLRRLARRQYPVSWAVLLSFPQQLLSQRFHPRFPQMWACVMLPTVWRTEIRIAHLCLEISFFSFAEKQRFGLVLLENQSFSSRKLSKTM